MVHAGEEAVHLILVECVHHVRVSVIPCNRGSKWTGQSTTTHEVRTHLRLVSLEKSAETMARPAGGARSRTSICTFERVDVMGAWMDFFALSVHIHVFGDSGRLVGGLKSG